MGRAHLLLLFVLLLTACSKNAEKTDRWEQAAASAQRAAEEKKSAPAASSAAPKADTGTLNKFFPADGPEGKRVFTADREGYAEAKLTQDGKDVALLAVTDLNGKDADKKKFEGAAEKVGTYPVATFGKNKSMILVNERWQVSVSSQTLDHAARKKLLEKFDLAGLRAL